MRRCKDLYAAGDGEEDDGKVGGLATIKFSFPCGINVCQYSPARPDLTLDRTTRHEAHGFGNGHQAVFYKLFTILLDECLVLMARTGPDLTEGVFVRVDAGIHDKWKRLCNSCFGLQERCMILHRFLQA